VPTIEATVEGGPEVEGMVECTGVAVEACVEGAVVEGTADEGMVEITAVVVEP